MPFANTGERNQLNIPRICIVGAGISGICAAIELKKKLNIQSFVVIEKNHEVGGVWLVNKYPGLVSQLPFEIYSYSFAPKTNWSKNCARRDEIYNYLQTVAKEYELYSHIRFSTSVKSMHWKTSTSTWILTTVNANGHEHVEEYNICIVATGNFREPNKPNEFNAFSGPIMHSAEWDSSIALDDKIVGVVGTGASAVQIIPAIASQAKEVIAYQRTPHYCLPSIVQGQISCVRRLMLQIPGYQNLLRQKSQFQARLLSQALKKDSIASKLSGQIHQAYRWYKIRDKGLRKKLTPNYPFGTKLFNVSSKFYECLQKPNVKLISEPILSVNGTNISIQDGDYKELDVLILCTGFKMQSYFAPIEIIGLNGTNLLNEWTKAWERPKVYYGLTCHLAPNMLFLVGPNTGMLNSVFCIVESQCKFLLNIIKIMMEKNVNYFQVKKSAEDKSWNEINNAMGRTVYGNAKGLSSTLCNEYGNNTCHWPKSHYSYYKKIKKVHVNDFDFC